MESWQAEMPGVEPGDDLGVHMSKNQWLVKPLSYIGGRFNSAARYLGNPELLAVKRQGVPIIHVLPLMTPWIRTLPVKTILDIGANTGQFAVAAMQIFPNAKLYSFEPLPDCYEQLCKRIAQSKNARAFNMGLGSETGELTFERSSSSVSSSFRHMAQTHKEAFPETSEQVPVKVKVARLDDIAATLDLPEPIFVKIDVQGFEDHVLRGGENLVKRAKWVVVETSFVPLYENQPLFDDVYRWMYERGFRLHGSLDQVTHPSTGEVLQADAVFIRGQ